ncbi:hypothetical protein TNCV_3638771 [Trichonephila clavipes]|nr:hypothetical protein TNCV_3638771 [Trichonephila clavipes]
MCCKYVSNDEQKGPASKEMAPQTITPYCGHVGRAKLKAESARCPGRLQTRLRLSSGHSWKRNSSINIIRPQST